MIVLTLGPALANAHAHRKIRAPLRYDTQARTYILSSSVVATQSIDWEPRYRHIGQVVPQRRQRCSDSQPIRLLQSQLRGLLFCIGRSSHRSHHRLHFWRRAGSHVLRPSDLFPRSQSPTLGRSKFGPQSRASHGATLRLAAPRPGSLPLGRKVGKSETKLNRCGRECYRWLVCVSFLAAHQSDQNSPLRVIRAKPTMRLRAEWA